MISDGDNERQALVEKVTNLSVKRDKAGQVNYYLDMPIEMYYPEGLSENEKVMWEELVNIRKLDLEKDLKNIFMEKDAVKRVNYSNRKRWLFPCPVKCGSYSSADIAKHLLVKHKWEKESVKLQTTYFHNMPNYVTPMNTYNQPRPCVCFKCRFVVECIDSHIALKHHSRGTQEYYDLLKEFRLKSCEIIFGSEGFELSYVHNLLTKMPDIINYRKSKESSKNIEKPAPSTEQVGSSKEQPGPSNKPPGPSTEQLGQ